MVFKEIRKSKNHKKKVECVPSWHHRSHKHASRRRNSSQGRSIAKRSRSHQRKKHTLCSLAVNRPRLDAVSQNNQLESVRRHLVLLNYAIHTMHMTHTGNICTVRWWMTQGWATGGPKPKKKVQRFKINKKWKASKYIFFFHGILFPAIFTFLQLFVHFLLFAGREMC